MLWQLPFIFGYLQARDDVFLKQMVKLMPSYFQPVLCALLFYAFKTPGLILATPFFVAFVIKFRQKNISYVLECLG